MDMKDLRARIDEIDRGLLGLLAKRFAVVRDVAVCKAKNGLPVYDPERERRKLRELGEAAGEELAPAVDALFSLIFDLSRSEQNRIVGGASPLRRQIGLALADTPAEFPARPMVACQGAEGGYSQLACGRIFPAGGVMYFHDSEDVFSAVGRGLCRYGVLPADAGAANRVYGLIMERGCSIVRSCRVKIDHCLLANPGASVGGVREVVSHERALAQCRDFLRSLGVKATPAENTAAAARTVRESGRGDLAALSPRRCAEIYGLDCLRTSVQDAGGSFARFVCISKEPEIYPGADRTSLAMALPRRRGSLLHALSRFNALGADLLRLESWPLADGDSEFAFYVELGVSVYSESFLRVFDDLRGAVATLKYLGSYSEVV